MTQSMGTQLHLSTQFVELNKYKFAILEAKRHFIRINYIWEPWAGDASSFFFFLMALQTYFWVLQKDKSKTVMHLIYTMHFVWSFCISRVFYT